MNRALVVVDRSPEDQGDTIANESTVKLHKLPSGLVFVSLSTQ